jgi:predicted NBD/HSP70 family sugar kinase
MSEPVKPLPRLALLREMTDRAVLDRVFADGRVTRAELAARTGISKPTISESVRRLEAGGVLRPTGQDLTGRRGRVATFYELARDTGYVLAAEINQDGVHTLAADLAARTVGSGHWRPAKAVDPGALTEALRMAVLGLIAEHGAPRAIAMSMATPVDQETGTTIRLPDSPFPEGPASPGAVLTDLAPGAPVLVDNDVNLAALAERRSGTARDAHSFAYIYVGAGLGMSVYLGDQLLRGAHGLAGEIGYLTAVADPDHQLTAAIAGKGFGARDAPALDVAALLGALDRAEAGDEAAAAAVWAVGTMIGHAVAATCTVVDPDLVLLGGPIGSRAGLVEPVRAVVERTVPAPVRVEQGMFTESAALHGALLLALDSGRGSLLTREN